MPNPRTRSNRSRPNRIRGSPPKEDPATPERVRFAFGASPSAYMAFAAFTGESSGYVLVVSPIPLTASIVAYAPESGASESSALAPVALAISVLSLLVSGLTAWAQRRHERARQDSEHKFAAARDEARPALAASEERAIRLAAREEAAVRRLVPLARQAVRDVVEMWSEPPGFGRVNRKLGDFADERINSTGDLTPAVSAKVGDLARALRDLAGHVTHSNRIIEAERIRLDQARAAAGPGRGSPGPRGLPPELASKLGALEQAVAAAIIELEDSVKQ